METPIYCLLLLNLVFRHVFSSDVEESARKISHHLGSECCYPDVTTRDLSAVPDCDLYIWGPPCQPFSKSGRQGGVDDQQNGQAILYGIAYIGAKRPAMFIMEQVMEIKTRHSILWKTIWTSLVSYGYHLTELPLNSVQFGLPQKRERLYLVGNATKKFVFELPPFEDVTLAKVILPLPHDSFELLPGRTATARQRDVVSEQIDKIMKKGINPFITPVVINSGASSAHAHASVETIMTLTKSECKKRAYWCSTKGGFMNVDELALCQGIPRGLVPRVDLGISDGQFGALIGNGMSLPILLVLIPQLLVAGGYISEDECCSLLLRVLRFDMFA